LDQRGQHLEAKIKSLDQEIIKQRDIMNKTRNPSQQNMAKQRALRLMKQKKMYEAQRDQVLHSLRKSNSFLDDDPSLQHGTSQFHNTDNARYNATDFCDESGKSDHEDTI
jgi:hypothetical protein